MQKKVLLHLLPAVFALPAVPQSATRKTFDGTTWWDHVKVLADDNMEGRDTGSGCEVSDKESGSGLGGALTYLGI